MAPPSSTDPRKNSQEHWPQPWSLDNTISTSTSHQGDTKTPSSLPHIKQEPATTKDQFSTTSKNTPPMPTSFGPSTFWENLSSNVRKKYTQLQNNNTPHENPKAALFEARALATSGKHVQALELYDNILAQFDSNKVDMPTELDSQRIAKERQAVYQQQLSNIKNTIEESFAALDSVQLSPYKSPKQRFEELNQLWPHFEANIATLLQKASEVKNTEDRRFLLTLLFNKTAQCPQTLWFGELSEKLLLKIFDSIELSLRKKASHEERLETYYSLLVSLDSVKMDSLQQRIVSQGDAVAAKLAQVASDGKSTTQRVNDLVLAQKYYQRRGKSQAVQEIDLQLRRQQDSFSTFLKSNPSSNPEAQSKLATLSVNIDQVLLEYRETKPTGEGLLSPIARAERHARHLAERAMLELQLKDKSSFQRWTTLQELSLQAARDQQQAQLKDSALNPEILKIAHPLLQEKLLDPLLQEFFFAQNEEDTLASGLESESRLPDDFEERQKTLSLFKQRYAKALSEGDAAWMLRYLSPHGLSSWNHALKEAYQTSKRADAGQGIVQLRLYHNAIAHFAQLGLETEVRQISQKIFAQGRALLNDPETLHLNYRQASTMPEHFGILDYWALLLRVAKLCQNHKLPQESNFLLNEIIASQDQRYLSSQENFSDADIETQRQNLIDFAMAYRFENNDQRLQAQKLLQEIASRGFLVENLIETESPLTHLDSIELVATRPVIPATELKDKIEDEELFQSNMAAIGTLSLYFAELEERYRIRAHSIRGQMTDDVVRAYRADGSDWNDDLTRSLQKARSLCDKLAYKLITGEIKSLKAGLQVKDSELSNRELYDLMELMTSIDRQFHGLQKNRSAFADLGFQDDIAPTLIEFVSTYPRNLKLAHKLLQLADRCEHREAALIGPLAIYRLIDALADGGETTVIDALYVSAQDLKSQARRNIDRLSSRADWGQALGKFIGSMSPAEIAFEVGLLFVSGGLGSLVRTSLMRESASGLTKAALQRAVTPSLSFRIPGLRHAASLEQIFANSMGFAVNYNTFNFGSIAHDMWVGNPDAEQILYGSIARGITLVGFELGGPLSRALAERGARGLGMVQTTGHLSNAGQSLLRHATHAGGLSVAMGAGTLNEELGLSPLPPGGPNEAYLIHAFGYAQLIWAKALVNKALGGKLAAFEHQPQLEYTVLLARHRVQIVLQKNKISISPAEEAILVDYLAQARLTRPDFNDQELSKLLNAIQGYVLANENKGESDRLSFYRQAQALLDEAGVPLTLIAEEILTSNEARLLRFDWKNPQTAPAEKIELPEEIPLESIPETVVPTLPSTSPRPTVWGLGFTLGLGLGIFSQSADPVAPEGVEAICLDPEQDDGPSRSNTSPSTPSPTDPSPSTPITPLIFTVGALRLARRSSEDPNSLAVETPREGSPAHQGKKGKKDLKGHWATLSNLTEDQELLRAFRSNLNDHAVTDIRDEELKTSWIAYVTTLNPKQAACLVRFAEINVVYKEQGKRMREPLLYYIARDPEKLDLFSKLTDYGLLGLEKAINSDPDFIANLFTVNVEWLLENNNADRILLAYFDLNINGVKNIRPILAGLTLRNGDQEDKQTWGGFVKEIIFTAQRANEWAQRPDGYDWELTSNPNLGIVEWTDIESNKKRGPVVLDFKIYNHSQQTTVYEEYKSAFPWAEAGDPEADHKNIEKTNNFKDQMHKQAAALRQRAAENNYYNLYFYSEVSQQHINYVLQAFRDLNVKIYIAGHGENPDRLIGEASRPLSEGSATAKHEAPRRFTFREAEVRVPDPEAEVSPALSRRQRRRLREDAAGSQRRTPRDSDTAHDNATQTQLPPLQWPEHHLASHVDETIRSRFEGTPVADFMDQHTNALFLTYKAGIDKRPTILAFQLDRAIETSPEIQLIAEGLLREYQQLQFNGPTKARIERETLWMLELIRRQETKTAANILANSFKKHVIQGRSVDETLSWLEETLVKEIKNENTEGLSYLGEITDSTQGDDLSSKHRYYLYFTTDADKELMQKLLESTASLADTTIFKLILPKDTYLYTTPVNIRGALVLVIDADALGFGGNAPNMARKTPLGEGGSAYMLTTPLGFHSERNPFTMSRFRKAFTLVSSDQLLSPKVKIDYADALWTTGYQPPIATAAPTAIHNLTKNVFPPEEQPSQEVAAAIE